MPVWAISSGTSGDPALPTEDSGQVLPLLAKLEECADFRKPRVLARKCGLQPIGYRQASPLPAR